jgi:hypothetical protein
MSGEIAPHVGHTLWLGSEYPDVWELSCSKCGADIWSAGDNTANGILLHEHRGHQIFIEGVQVVCSDDGTIIASEE